MKYKTVKGMSDIVFPDIQKWQFIENIARSFFGGRLYEEIRTPIVEYTELFSRSIGEATDIVNKEMYTFKDRGERSLTLRPEMTASVVRAVIENNLLKKREPLKLFYIGPMFRAERPQAGRKRQFFQIGVEVIGNSLAFCDVEVIRDAANFLRRVGLKENEFSVKLNNVGCPKCRPSYKSKLNKYFSSRKNKLCEDCLFKFEKNILRIFDCKNDKCIKLCQEAPKMIDDACEKCSSHFQEVEKGLKLFNVPYVVDKTIIRGLDYYTSTVFEVTSSCLGAKDAILAGGRYDNLMKELGGEDKSAIGFALGLERLLLCLEKSLKDYSSNVLDRTVYIAYSDEKYIEEGKRIAARLEKCDFATYMDVDGRSLNSQLKRANKFGLRWVLILNKDEVERGECTLKDFCYEGQDQCIIYIKTLENQVSHWIEQGLKKKG